MERKEFRGRPPETAREGRNGVSAEQRTYEDYEEIGRYLIAAKESVTNLQRKSFDMFGGLEPLTEGTVTMETRPRPTAYDSTILEVVVRRPERCHHSTGRRDRGETTRGSRTAGSPRYYRMVALTKSINRLTWVITIATLIGVGLAAWALLFGG